MNLSKAFRDDYELNPVATYRAKMLLGAEKNVEFNSVLTERMEEFKTKFLRENGDKPSYSQISEAINEITDDYLANDTTLSENAIMRTGFLQEASVNINKLKQTLPSAMAEEHKQEVLIPNLASSLARMHGSEDRDLERLKSHWEASSSSLSRSEQIKTIDATLGILNFDSSEDELDDGIAFLENMRDAGVAIGTTRLDSSGTPLGESFYEMRLDDLEEMREAVVEKERKNANVRIRGKTIEYEDKYKAASKSGHTENSTKVFEDIKEEERRIEKLDVSDYERKGYLKALEQGVNDGFREESDTIDALEVESGRSNASPQAMLSETRRMLVTYVQTDLEGEKYKGVDVSEALIGERIPAGKTADPRTGDDFTTFALGPELQKILSEKNQQFLNERAEAMELVARLDPGEEITLGDKVYTIKDGENIERKRNSIISEHMTSRMGVIMASSKEAVDEILDSFAEEKKQKETTEAQQKLIDKRLPVDEKELENKSKEMLRVGVASFGKSELYGESSARMLTGTGVKRQVGFGEQKRTDYDMPKLFESVEHTIRHNPNSPEEMQEILGEVGAVYDKAVPMLRRELTSARESYHVFKNSSNPEMSEKAAQEYQNKRNDILRARRLFQGYTFDDVKKAISVKEGEPGYLLEGVALRDPKEFFRFEFSGLGAPGQYQTGVVEYKAKAMLKGATDEQVTELAGMLGLEPERIKGSQKRLSDYILNRKGEKAAEPKKSEKPEEPKEPEVVPTVPEEEPEKPPVTEAVKPKARPPIPEGPSFENYKRSRSSRAEQLELPLDNAKPAVGSVGKTTTDLVKQFEGEFQSKAFWDNKQYSIGFGTVANKGKGQTMTLAQAEKELAKELTGHAKKVDSYDKTYNWTPNERAALISFTFNLGDGGLDKLTNKGKRTKQEIAEKILLYNKETVKGKKQFSKGLDNRRKAERKKFLTK